MRQAPDVGERPNNALEPTAYSFGFATLRLRFRRRLTVSVDMTSAVKSANDRRIAGAVRSSLLLSRVH